MQEIAKELWRAATDVGFFCAPLPLLALVLYMQAFASQQPCSMHGQCANLPLTPCTMCADLTNFGISPEEIAAMFAMSKAFFALPADVKGRYGFDQVRAEHAAMRPSPLMMASVIRPVRAASAA